MTKTKEKIFVEHIQKHLDAGDTGCKGGEITPGVVGCTICGKDINEIYEDEGIDINFYKAFKLMYEGKKMKPEGSLEAEYYAICPMSREIKSYFLYTEPVALSNSQIVELARLGVNWVIVK